MRVSLFLFLLVTACGGNGDQCSSDEMISVYPDADGDSFGNSNLSESKCKPGPGFVKVGGDCADDDADTFPGAREVCDSVDNNCNLAIDETLPLLEFYQDADQDGRGIETSTVMACQAPDGFVDNTEDCDDTDDRRYYGAAEICDGIDNDCDDRRDDQDDDLDPASATAYYRDNDGDSYGNVNSVKLSCGALTNGWVLNPDDCNDNFFVINPLAVEVCNTIDDNCDTLIDEADPFLDLSTRSTIYADADQDGWGDPLATLEACSVTSGYVANDDDCDDTDPLIGNPAPWFLDADSDGWGDGVLVEDCVSPGAYYVAAAFPPFDCDDADPLVFPGAPEVCNGGVDDNCNGIGDDGDVTLDMATATVWYIDLDEDGYGDPLSTMTRCQQPANPPTSLDDTDCDDTEADIYPLATEVCDGLDNDCNGDTDDDDAAVDPAGYQWWYLDADGDGYGDPLDSVSQCDPPSLYVGNRDDCDDMNPLLGSPADWYPDLDLDGYGDASGPPLGMGPSCIAPVPGAAPDTGGYDCDDADPTINPGEMEVCEDGIDNDCLDGDQVCPLPASCLEHLTKDPLAVSGTYTIEPLLGFEFDVYCDMTTDNGGWTLVASTRTNTMNDEASFYYADLALETPSFSHTGIWGGMRWLITDTSDIRFACKGNVFDANMTVDLSFYDIHWYREITEGSDSDSCFNEGNGAGYDQPAPARQNNLTMDFLPEGDDWNQGYLEGEDSCGDTSDFTVDFDDRGKDANQSDGTDWGEDDNTRKCGFNNFGQVWYIFVREI